MGYRTNERSQLLLVRYRKWNNPELLDEPEVLRGEKAEVDQLESLAKSLRQSLSGTNLTFPPLFPFQKRFSPILDPLELSCFPEKKVPFFR